ncbi:hypothetical protein Tco_1126196 [Tanacetum coccineum]
MLNNIMAAWSNASSPMLGQKIFTMEITVLIQAVPEAEGRPAVQTTIGIANWIDMIQYENKEHFQYENGSNFIAFNWALQQGGIVERTDVKTNLFWNLRSLLSEMENHGVVLLTLWGYGKRRLSVVQTGYSALTAWDSWALCKGMQEAKAGTQFSDVINHGIMDDEYSDMTRYKLPTIHSTRYSRIRDTLIPTHESVKKSIGERAQHKMEYERRVNERQIQTTEEKTDTSNALDAWKLFQYIESNGTESKDRDTSSQIRE